MHDSLNYFAVTADIIGSRKEGANVRRAEGKLCQLNAGFKDSIAVEFVLFRGDEIQGVLTAAADLPRFIRHLRFQLRPLDLRIGVGCGSIESGWGREYSWQMDGSAFHHSREALKQIERSRVPATRFAGGDAAGMETINTFYKLLDTIQARWSEKQWSAVAAYDCGGTYALAGKELGITAQSVNKHCRAAGFGAVRESEFYLAELLKGV